MLIDSHCHLNYPGLIEDQAGAIARARAAGVGGMLSISTRESEWADVIGLAETAPDIWATVGIHPHEADQHPDIATDKLIAASAHPRVVGIGETGLDFFYDKSDRLRQEQSFRTHLAAAQATGLPVIVHTRDADEDTVRILKDMRTGGEMTGVIHCFTASDWLADEALALGFYISISGIVTFKNAKALQASAARIPADKLLVETDSPFLAPVPMRGKSCEPAFVAHTAQFLADLRGVDVETLSQQTSDNFFTLFRKADRP